MLLGRSLVRYVAGLPLTIAMAALLSLIFGQRIATPLMVETSQVSVVAVLLPLVAGAAAEIQEVINTSGLARLVEANVRFTRADISGQNSLLAVVYVQRAEGTTMPADELRGRITEAIQSRLHQRGYSVTPLVDVNVLEAAGSP
jgi:uncharacterized membrane protein